MSESGPVNLHIPMIQLKLYFLKFYLINIQQFSNWNQDPGSFFIANKQDIKVGYTMKKYVLFMVFPDLFSANI